MDLTLDVEDYRLNIRAAGVIIHDGKVLIHNDVNSDHVCLPGGRITLGENSKDAVIRELTEEIGKPVEFESYMTTVENFFVMDDKKYHEIMFVYKVEFKNEEDKKINETIHNVEGKDYLQYDWVEPDKLDEWRLMPACLRKIVKTEDCPRNSINID